MSQTSEVKKEKKKSSMTSAQRKSKYRDLLDQVEILKENEESGLETAEVLDKILGSANLLFKDSSIKERIKHTDEVLLDAKVVATASDVLLHITESIDCTLDTYEHLELARKINAKLLVINEDSEETSEETDYTKLTRIACKFINWAPKFLCLYGELGNPNVEEKPAIVKKPRTQRNKKEEQATKKRPEKVTEVNKEEDSVDDTVKFLQWALNKECEESNSKQLDYFKFLFDPSSFSATIENMFHFSFLIRDGRAKLNHVQSGIILITPVSSHDAKRAKREGVVYQQFIFPINIEEWHAIISSFKIENCVLSKWKAQWGSRKRDSV